MILHDHSDDDALVLQVHLGGDRNFSYLLGDLLAREGAVVDPGFEPDRLAALAEERGLALRHILLTHGHSDHAAGAEALRRRTGAPILADPREGVPGAVALPADGRLPLGRHAIRCLPTPGHTPGHTAYLFAGRLLTGDLLFCGKVGGTGPFFPGSSAEAEWESLQRILALPDETLVLPGHDYYGGPGSMPFSSLGHERAHNPFLLCPDLDAFIDLKENWVAYKREHGIR